MSLDHFFIFLLTIEWFGTCVQTQGQEGEGAGRRAGVAVRAADQATGGRGRRGQGRGRQGGLQPLRAPQVQPHTGQQLSIALVGNGGVGRGTQANELGVSLYRGSLRQPEGLYKP